MAILFFVGVILWRTQAQAVLTPWGNLAGIRTEENLLEFEAGLRVVLPDWSGFSPAVKYLQKPRYAREGNRRRVESKVEGLSFVETLEDIGPGEAVLRIQLTADQRVSMAGAYFCLDLPEEFAAETAELFGSEGSADARMLFSRLPDKGETVPLRAIGSGVRVRGPSGWIEVRSAEPTEVLVRRDRSERPTAMNDPLARQAFVEGLESARPTGIQLYFRLMAGDAEAGARAEATFSFKAKAEPNTQPVRLTVDVTKPGRPFDGIGGNFRLQFPKTDPAVIAYNLEHLRVAWGRVAMSWAEWDPQEKVSAGGYCPCHPRRTGLYQALAG